MIKQGLIPPRPKVVYPESDGQPMAENTLQFEWIVTIKGGLDAEFMDDPNVFVAGDLFWYPVEGDNTIRQAPDTLVAMGRPKGHRRSYLQWEEENIPPQVVWEVLSPGNRPAEMERKFRFYETHGVEEYYIYDPDHGTLEGWIRQGDRLVEIPTMQGWVSPRLGVRFELINGELQLFGRGNRKFASYLELVAQRDQALQQAQQAQKHAETAQKLADENARANQKLRAQLKSLGVEPEN